MSRLYSSQSDIIRCLCKMCINSEPAFQVFNKLLLFHKLTVLENYGVFSSVYCYCNRSLFCFGRNLCVMCPEVFGRSDDKPLCHLDLAPFFRSQIIFDYDYNCQEDW